MKSHKSDIAELGETIYDYDDTKKYEYINVATLSPGDQEKIIDVLEKKNFMPNNFLNFICVTYLDHLRTIYEIEQKLKANNFDNIYNISLATWKEYQENKFGIRIKQDINNKDDKQVILFMSKNLELYDQFFLQKTLKEEKYYFENLEFSLTPTQSSKKVKSTSSSGIIDGTNNNSKNNSIITTKSQGLPKKFQKQKQIDKFIKGNVLESEVCNYLRNKICSEKGNIELPNVYYTMKKIQKKGKDEISLFYNEFDSVFIVNENVKLDKNVIKLNCKYENNEYENSKEKNINILEIKEKRIVFVECKSEENYKTAFGNKNIFKKIYSFRNFIDNVYGTKDYGIIILYIYNDRFINNNDNYNNFVNCLEATFKTCMNEKMSDALNYDIFSYYICHNVYMYNYFNLNNELKEVKEDLQKAKKDLNATQIELETTKKFLNAKIEELTKKFNLFMEKFGNKNIALENAPTAGKK